MTHFYTIVLIPAKEGGYSVYIPAFKNATEGEDLYDAIFMAKDAIGLLGVTMQNCGERLPEDVLPDEEYKGYQTTLVDVDFDLYRKKMSHKSVRKNITIPAWMDEEAKKKKINFSQVMQDALREILSA
ncbi:type II toxin-antitoxin system HicB family antitoxin [Murdochiella sp. Marseille-P8839]|nr:type II toxin-antitoxin system HicB family antitoxin [Murdochiella sp. Marseille-P8839]